MRLSQDQKYRVREKIRCVCDRKARLGVEIWNKSEMERRHSEIVSAETLTKCKSFLGLSRRYLLLDDCPCFGRHLLASLPLLWEVWLFPSTLEAAVPLYMHPIAEARMEARPLY
jgi:hypothetical protein